MSDEVIITKLEELIAEQKRANGLLMLIINNGDVSARHDARLTASIELAPLAAAEAARRAQQKADRDIPD